MHQVLIDYIFAVWWMCAQ